MVISPSLKLVTQYMDAVRASPGVANLAWGITQASDTAIFEIFQKISSNVQF